jgi:hypothetical protein
MKQQQFTMSSMELALRVLSRSDLNILANACDLPTPESLSRRDLESALISVDKQKELANVVSLMIFRALHSEVDA